MAGNFFTKLFKKSNRSENFYSSGADYSSYSAPRTRKFSLAKLRLSRTKLIIISIAVISVIGLSFWFKKASDNIRPVQGTSSSTEQVAAPYATKHLNREFVFPLRNEKGDKVSEFKYIIQDAELAKEIVVKGQKQSTIAGRSLLIVNLKLKNDGKQKIQVNTRDFVRLIINDNTEEMTAPGVYNDPVEVQPISTMFTRIGFAINETDTNIKLQVGEIEGEKQIVEVQF